ncbi:MAG TPA: class I SAM-dependent methyltransferase [Hanamia sp.]
MIIDYNNKEEDYYQHARPEMAELIPETAKFILDVGCSSGNFGMLLKQKKGIVVWGIEPNKEASDLAKKKLDRVFCNYFDDNLDLEDQRFDCIIFNDVLEHLIEPMAALQLCKKILNQNGCVVCSIPNIRYFEAVKHILIEKDFHYTRSGIFDATHLRFFTKKSIERLFADSGFFIKTIEGINSLKGYKKRYRLFKRLNFLLNNKIADMEFLQFAIVAYPSQDS